MDEKFKDYLTIDNNKAYFNFKTEEGFNTFKIGFESSPQNWSRHPETQKFHEFINTNREYSEIYIKYNDYIKRIK